MSIFKRNKPSQPDQPSRAQGIQDVGNVPLTAYDAAKAEWNLRNGDSTVNQARFFIYGLFVTICLVILAASLYEIIPLHRPVPYNIQVDKVTGESVAVGISAKDAKATQQQKIWFISRWTKQLLTLDTFTTESALNEAYEAVRGKAIEEFRDFVHATQPIRQVSDNKNLSRTVTLVNAPQFLADNIAQVRVITERRSIGVAPLTKRFILTIHFVLEPPSTDEEIMKNPIGLYITHFGISEEMQ